MNGNKNRNKKAHPNKQLQLCIEHFKKIKEKKLLCKKTVLGHEIQPNVLDFTPKRATNARHVVTRQLIERQLIETTLDRTTVNQNDI